MAHCPKCFQEKNIWSSHCPHCTQPSSTSEQFGFEGMIWVWWIIIVVGLGWFFFG